MTDAAMTLHSSGTCSTENDILSGQISIFSGYLSTIAIDLDYSPSRNDLIVISSQKTAFPSANIPDCHTNLLQV